ncbi:acetylcholine receptor subunit alpha-type acr-16 [Stomoxys calcitrans]|uniref:acetylcholine receptor subunit alpha-type acr-16 n=1 Tax=Stomoxys calcitrans TaxID=35570 RepID=UPI0027E229EA|nr:acetylcholine receptor subunit alpha-type acr-16 [Stomoxys calcitrans]
MTFRSFVLGVVVVSLVYPAIATDNSTLTADDVRDLLMKTLLTNYHPSSKPGPSNEIIMVFVNIELQHFDYRARDGAFHLVGILYARWRDPKLVWNPSNYGNMRHISIGQRYVWVPDLEFYNNAPDKFMRMHRNGFVTVKNNGVVLWSDTIEANIFCSTNMKNWPHDSHDCKLTLGSWTFDGLELDILHINANASMNFSVTNRLNMEYKVTKYNASHETKYYPCCPSPYVSMDYNITFERESSYVVIFRVPGILIIAFTLLGLNLEPSRCEMFWLNALSLWLITGHLIYFANIGHHFSKETPNIVIFYSTSFILVTISQLVAVFSKYATRSQLKFKYPMPHMIDWMLYSTLALRLVPVEGTQNAFGRSMRHSKLVPLEGMDDVSNLIDQRYQPEIDWTRFAKLLQRLTFCSIAITYLIVSTVCFV